MSWAIRTRSSGISTGRRLSLGFLFIGRKNMSFNDSRLFFVLLCLGVTIVLITLG